MVKEYHNNFLHVIIDCKTGNKDLDTSVESSINGYVYLVLHAIKTDQMGVLMDKMVDIANEFKKKDDINK